MIINVNEYTDEQFVSHLEKTFPMASIEYFVTSLQFTKKDCFLTLLADCTPELKNLYAYNALKKSTLKENTNAISYTMDNDMCDLQYQTSMMTANIHIDRDGAKITLHEDKFFNCIIYLNKRIIKITNKDKTETEIVNHANFYRIVLLLFFLKHLKTSLYEDKKESDFLTSVLNDPEKYESILYLEEMKLI